MRTTSAKPYEVVEGETSFPCTKKRSQSGREAAAFGCAAFSLHIILTVPIVTRGNLRHNRKTVPVSCETGKNVCHGQNEEKAEKSGK